MRTPSVAGVLAVATASLLTACHGKCYMIRDAVASGNFGDTLVAISGTGSDPGTVRLSMAEQNRGSSPFRYGDISAWPLSSTDTSATYRFTLFSDKARTPFIEKASPNRTLQFYPSADEFEKLFVGLGTEDVLVEVRMKNGTVFKARLNLEQRNDLHEYCEPYT